ncbi:hypothetical protein [Photobacterium angustum]|uniref:Uncharacterized protein n=1 Tax=Photobacterium angustum TaxID=661 RepID=A0A855SF39_PHOAN|nr:hypothetical protein [Photobacterium angustum]KJF80777.1 hypothetical protein UB36_15230 [Photobacterium damselae subsp. damselae]KJG38342.1 hypothetical protein UA35_15190 [Photobacterium angustum]KJG44240.1 hypothetical protein UA31_15235 [Photobacterium angustum]KJG48029.1 hypothetical protein UA30_15130 [Photobacterium angustum]KJG51915.1 hypothetical protein UA34_16005 [Photobacterium angustum]
MKIEQDVIDTLEELKTFITSIENGGLGLKDVEGIGLAKNNADGRPFIAVFDKNQQLIYGRWLSQDVYDNGKDIVRNGVKHH